MLNSVGDITRCDWGGGRCWRV